MVANELFIILISVFELLEECDLMILNNAK